MANKNTPTPKSKERFPALPTVFLYDNPDRLGRIMQKIIKRRLHCYYIYGTRKISTSEYVVFLQQGIDGVSLALKENDPEKALDILIRTGAHLAAFCEGLNDFMDNFKVDIGE